MSGKRGRQGRGVAERRQMPKRGRRVARRAERRRAFEAGELCGVFGLDYWEIPVEDAAWLCDEGGASAQVAAEGPGRDGQDYTTTNPY